MVTPTYKGHWHAGQSDSPEWDFTKQYTIQPEYHEHPSKPRICGHWHQNGYNYVPITLEITDVLWQQSVDVYDTSIAVIGQGIEAYTGGLGIVCAMLYESNWEIWGAVSDYAPVYGTPNSCAVYLDATGTVESLYYCLGNDIVGGSIALPEYGTLFRFRRGEEVQRIDVWEEVSSPLTSFDIPSLNTMDAGPGSPIIACLAKVFRDAGVLKVAWGIKISTDYGATFGSTLYFPAYSSSNDQCYVRVSNDGTVWILYYRLGTKVIELWQATSADSWASINKIWERNWTLDLAGTFLASIGFDVSSTDGNSISIIAEIFITGVGYKDILYLSTDYGSTFAASIFIPPSYRVSGYHTSEGSTINAINIVYDGSYSVEFYHSEDSGVTFDSITSPLPFYTSNISFRHSANEIVYAYCGSESDDGYLNLAYSNDGGATWTDLSSSLPSDVGVAYTGFYEAVAEAHNPVWPFTKHPDTW